ncbi:MAG: DUF433 domain-containing protein [Anaerolineales bacterium]
MMVDWKEHITVDPAVCHGQACFSDTRILVSAVLDNLAAGASVESVLASYPSLTREAVQASLAYAAELTRERVLAMPG